MYYILIDTQFCEHNPGVCNNGVCTTTGIDQYLCTCTDGYTGTNCDTGLFVCLFVYGLTVEFAY